MTILKLKRTKLNSVLTTLDPTLDTPIEDQRAAIANFATKAPRVIVTGPEVPAKADGIRHTKTAPVPQLSHLLGVYMQTIPGAEVCLLTNPDVLITGDILPLLQYVDGLKMELAWASGLNLGGKPKAFVLSSLVAVHLMNDIPAGMTLKHDWQTWVHGWMGRLLRQRYFDGTQYDLLTAISLPKEAVQLIREETKEDVVNVYSLTKPVGVKPKRGNVRKVKVGQ